MARAAALSLVKAFHSLAFLTIQTAILYLLWKGLRGESDRRAVAAFAIAAGETLVYVGNGFRCPLTGLAERLGSQHGQVTDIFLPKRLADNIDKVYTPLFAAGVLLHARSLTAGRRDGAPTD
jgi:hypothetical protein